MSLQKNRKYKVTIILDTRGYEAPVETIEETVSVIFKELNGEVESIDNVGRRDFIRITDKNHTGDSYLDVVISGPATLPAEFQEKTRLNKLIKLALFQSA